MLLGQSFLSHFKSWSIDNQRQVLILGSPQAFDVTAPASYAILYPPRSTPRRARHAGVDGSGARRVANAELLQLLDSAADEAGGGSLCREGQEGHIGPRPLLVGQPRFSAIRPTDPAWRAHAQSAMLAVKKCDPLRVPTQYLPYFEEWKVETIHFDPRETQN